MVFSVLTDIILVTSWTLCIACSTAESILFFFLHIAGTSECQTNEEKNKKVLELLTVEDGIEQQQVFMHQH